MLKKHTNTSTSLAILALLLGADAWSDVVHIQVERRSGTEFGAGYTVGRDAECFIVTPQHVVEFATPDSITVTDGDGSGVHARIVKEIPDFDLALLRLTESAPFDCPADWSDGARANESIGEAPFLIARKVDDAGRVVQTRFFVSSSTPEEISIQPYRAEDELREGDSGSPLYAGNELIGLITAVDTRSGEAKAITQSQIHGLFGPDVLPNSLARAVVAAFTYRRAENAYAATAAREYLSDNELMQVLSIPLDGSGVPDEADYVISGNILQIATSRENNPDYAPPAADNDSGNVGRRLFSRLQEQLEDEVNEALDRNVNARYLRNYTIDVQIEIQDLAENRLISNLGQVTFQYPVLTGNGTELQNTAITDAVKQVLALTLQENDLL